MLQNLHYPEIKGSFFCRLLMKIPYSKPFQTYKEQIQLLQSRGMIFDDENKAENILEAV
jgi:hypothetical protein